MANTTTERKRTLLSKLGGMRSLRKVVDALYDRILDDESLQGFFVDVDLGHVKAQQVAFFATALGGRAQYKGPDMKRAHAHMSIESKHFDSVAVHLVAVLDGAGVPKKLIDEVVGLVAPLKGDIVTSKGESSNGHGGRGNQMRSQSADQTKNGTNGHASVAPPAPEPSDAEREGAQVVDALGDLIVVADTDFKVRVGVGLLMRTFEDVEEELDEVCGCTLDELAEGGVANLLAPDRKSRRALKDPSNLPLTRSLRLGASTFEVEARGMTDDGELTGYVVTVRETSGQAALARVAARDASMLSSAPINILYCDRDFTIQYANPASVSTLGTLEQYLPCKLDEVVGSSIDIFHKNPQHQRTLLSDPANLPHQAIIDFGPEKLDLLVSATYDGEGEYLGPMVTWSIVTQKIKTEREMARVNSMMENSPINIIYADLNFVIQYVNPASVATLKTLEQYLPCKVDDIIGQSIDIFHKNPQHQRTLLSDPANLPHQAVIDFGPEKLDLLVSAIWDNKGNYLGPMVSWSVVTQKIKTEREMARVSSMMENSPINIIYADTDFVIQYVNPASVSTLKTLEQYLPCKVDDLVGQSIDIFHKNPQHQRTLLSDPANLPHQAIIDFGPEKLDLLVSAIWDNNGNYLGPMVSWSVVTQKIKTEREMARVSSMMENSPINIIYADTDFVIQYVNPASVTTLKTLEQYLPCKLEDIVGQSIDIFHKNPQHQRTMLSDPANLPHQAVIDFGPEKLDLLVSAIWDNNGNYLGPMVSWSVVTQKLKTEREMARVNSMMENSPMNVMYADTNYVIQYMNPASTRTLKTIEEHLPVKVDDIIGQTFDVFHKAPEHQRRIVGDPGNLPHQAEIMVGPETLDLLVSAIYDNKGEYLGAMATWEVITARLQAEKEREEGVQREAENAATLRAKVDDILTVVDAAAGGDLTKAVTVSGEDAIGQMGEGLGRFFVDLRDVVGNITTNAGSVGESSGELLGVSQQMSSAAEETSAQATVVSSAADEVSRNVQTVAAGIEELGASVREIAHNANNAASVATEAVSVAETTNTTIAQLGESSAEIGKVVKVITSIAQQTNLLALNATIEAARAGEAGKGFAVVANEVKELAKETSSATEDIGRKIEAIQANTAAAVDAIGRISTIINQINEIQSTIATAVEEQTATTNEISRNVADAARGSSEIAENITAVATAAQSTTEGAADTQRSASELGEMADALQALVSRFTV